MSLLLCALTQGPQCQQGLSQCSKQPFIENRVQVGNPFGWNFVHKQSSDKHTDTHTQTNLNGNITPPQFRGGVIKKGYCVTVILTFDPGSPNSIGFEPMQYAAFSENHVQIGASVRLKFVHKHSDTDRQTDRQTNCKENVTPLRFHRGVKYKH